MNFITHALVRLKFANKSTKKMIIITSLLFSFDFNLIRKQTKFSHIEMMEMRFTTQRTLQHTLHDTNGNAFVLFIIIIISAL